MVPRGYTPLTPGAPINGPQRGQTGAQVWPAHSTLPAWKLALCELLPQLLTQPNGARHPQPVHVLYIFLVQFDHPDLSTSARRCAS